ncbi:MAG: M20 family metallopeptidase [Bryobacterales bacterium]|nr:M20 family metallopeptidase [Bryobacterales bacterium]
MTNQPRVLSILADLVRINSINPAYDQGQPESTVADYVRKFFEGVGLETWEQEVSPGRPNRIGKLPGQGKGRVILEAHMDTASINGMTIPPFEPEIRDGKLYGRGSCDTKAGLAAMMDAVASLHEAGQTPPCEVWLSAVADEEYAFTGVLKLCEGLTADAAIVAEPTELRNIVATKGVLRWRIRTRGKAAHSSKAHLGVNAIEHMAHVVLAIGADNARLAAQAPHPLLGPGTLNVGVIAGGVQVNFVPDGCAIEIDRRLLPGERVSDVLAHHERMLDELRARLPGFDAVQEEPMLADEALETSADSPVAATAAQVLNAMGLNGTAAGVPYGSDASKLARIGVPCIVFGPGSIDQAHAAVEWVDCAQVVQAAEFYRRFLLEFKA